MVSTGRFVCEDKGDFSSAAWGFLPRIARIPIFEENAKNAQKKIELCVSVGEAVEEGSVLARSPFCVVRSSVPGVVESIVRGRYGNGKPGEIVCVKTGGHFSFTGKLDEEKTWERLSNEEIAERIREAGVVNTFSSCETLFPQIFGEQKKEGGVLFVRFFDDDPSRCVESFISEHFTGRLFSGIKMISRLISPSAIVLAYDKSSAISRRIFKESERGAWDEGNVLPVGIDARKYPCGTQNDVIRAAKNAYPALLKNLLKSRANLFVDAPCALSVYEAVALSIPVLSRFVHVNGGALRSSAILRVKIGTTLLELSEQFGGFKKNVSKIVVNGSILGTSVSSLDVPVSKLFKSVSFFSENEQEAKVAKISACIRCGECRNVCPVGLWPGNIYRVYKNAQSDAFRLSKESQKILLDAKKCIGCSLCNMSCPARLSLSEMISIARFVGGENNEQEL